MGIKLSDLTSGTRAITAKWGDLTIRAEYRMSERTMAATEEKDDVDHPWLVKVLASWDIEDDDGHPIPVTLESVKQVPIPILNSIIAAIYGDDGVGEAVSNSAST